MAYGLFQRKAGWYWRATWRRRPRMASAFRNFRVAWSVDIALSLTTVPASERYEAAMRLSVAFTVWMQRLDMLGLLEKLSQDDVDALVGWALADLRDLYVQRMPEPQRVDDETRNVAIHRLRMEICCIQGALDTGNFEMVEGIAAGLLRRRSIRCDFNSGEFAAFVRAVAPILIEARLSELVRLEAPLGAPLVANLAAAPTPTVHIQSHASATAPIPLPRQPPLPLTRTGHPVSGKTIEDCLEGLLKKARKEKRLSEKTIAQYRQSVGMLIQLFGNVPAYQISRQLADDFQDFILRLPSKYGQSAHYANLPLREIPDHADKLRDEKRLTAQTWNRHQVALSKVWHYAEKRGHVVENVFDELWIYLARKNKTSEGGLKPDNEVRPPLMEERLALFFSSPLYTGMRSHQFRHQAGSIVEFNAMFWIPLLMVLTGIRREEAAQIKFCDIAEVNGVQCIMVREGPGQTLKNGSAPRNIPISSELKRLGFLDFVQDRKGSGGEFIFAECKPSGKFRRRGDIVGKAIGRYLRNIGITEKDLCLYSLRHDFARFLELNKSEPCRVDRLMGHATGRIAFDRYTTGLEKVLLEEIEKIDVSYLASVRPYSAR